MVHAIIGGGAAGYFTALNIAERNPEDEVIILEGSRKVLDKVRISGGGRCNVTHACFEPKELVKNYPRGSRELLGPFHKFQPGDTIAWFAERGVELKIEEDGRMFPITDNSETIIDCFTNEAKKLGVRLRTQFLISSIAKMADGSWTVKSKEDELIADRIYVCTGSSRKTWDQLAELGHSIVKPVASLFTFKIKDARIEGLSGVSVPVAEVAVEGIDIVQSGPLLITHRGLSGPAILRMSAWGARELSRLGYRFNLRVNWLGFESARDVQSELESIRQTNGRLKPYDRPQFGLPKRLWRSLVLGADIDAQQTYGDLSKWQMQEFAEELTSCRFQVAGKNTFKDEFVTAGGVALEEVDFRTMESKLHSGLYFAGEVLDIDAITGGFNFQNAWTTAFLAAKAGCE